LSVKSIEVALDFYRTAFGAEEAFRVGEGLVFVRLGGGEVVGLDSRSERDRNPAHFGLRRADGQQLDDAVRKIEQAGGSLLERGEHAPGVPFAYVADPDGNVLEL